MMIKENGGQISLEYMMIFTISLIILIVFTLPLAENSIKDTLDISDSLNVKSDLSKISNAIRQVYGEGQGSKQTIKIESKNRIKINIEDSYISTSFKLKSNSKKDIKNYVTSNIQKTSISLDDRENIIVVDWPMNSKNMLIYTI
ncbi:class III signal peptide-containing protein [Methanobrevibacter sp.]|uniref:class III signal peptide-containing protein n=1 Tax=Methanobrevibacter sp. TaxID=66852 RepID=UPI003D7D49E2